MRGSGVILFLVVAQRSRPPERLLWRIARTDLIIIFVLDACRNNPLTAVETARLGESHWLKRITRPLGHCLNEPRPLAAKLRLMNSAFFSNMAWEYLGTIRRRMICMKNPLRRASPLL